MPPALADPAYRPRDAELERRLFPAQALGRDQDIPPPDCQRIHDELRDHRKVNLTLTQLWVEYKERHPEGYQYTQYCEHYRRWLGEMIPTQLFVAAWGARRTTPGRAHGGAGGR